MASYNLAAQKARFETLASLDYTSLGSGYTTVTTLEYPSRILWIDNLTDVTITISDDGTNAKFVLAAYSGKVIDFGSDKANAAGNLEIPSGTTLSAATAGSPTIGEVYIGTCYASTQ